MGLVPLIPTNYQIDLRRNIKSKLIYNKRLIISVIKRLPKGKAKGQMVSLLNSTNHLKKN